MSEQYVYFIQADENGPIKIGFTADDPKRRLGQLQTGNASALKLLGAIQGTASQEKQFHSALSEWRLQGEWFEPHPTVIAAVQDALAMAAIEKPRFQISDHDLRCSFCFRSNKEIEGAFVFGGAANICEECIKLCTEIVEANLAAKRGETQ